MGEGRSVEDVVALCEAGAKEAASAVARFCAADVESGAVAAANVDDLVRRHPGTVVAVSFTLSGAVAGPFAVLMWQQAGRRLGGRLIGARIADEAPLPPRAEAALAELGNITASAYLNGVARLLQGSCVPSPPRVLQGEGALVLKDALAGARRVVLAPLAIDGSAIALAHALG